MKLAQRKANRERWVKEVQAWRASGKPLSEWARRRNLSRDALEYWKRRIPAGAARLPAPARRPLTLIPVEPAAAPAAPIELVFDGLCGLSIRLPAGFEAAALSRLLDVLQARC